ncbi:MAG: methyltransferase domain-containing protein [Magnetococcales bacterium]|nr:methyltransferase domain-containing protein [Magnetococcales bacterium]
MTESREQESCQRWDRHWQATGRIPGVSRMGRLMFHAKEEGLRRVMAPLREDVKTILEVGCGPGHIMAMYQRLGFAPMGIDISPTAVAICQERGLAAVERDVMEEPGRYDLVSSDGMLEHFLHFEPMAVRMMHLSRRYVLLIQPNHGSFWGRVLPCLAELIKGEDNILEYNYRMIDFIEVFRRHGFDVVENRPVFGDVFRILLFQSQKMSEHVL